MNRFDTPAQDKYFNTYVPLPYEQIMATVASRQAQSDRIQEAIHKTFEDTKDLTYIAGSPDEKYIRDYTGKVGDLVAQNLTVDFSNPIAVQQMRSKFNAMTNKQDIQNIQASKANWDANNKLKAQRIANGTYDPYFDQDPASKWDTVGSGNVYNYITPGRVDEAKLADEYFNTESITKGKTLAPKGDYNMHGTTEGMTNAVADENWQHFSNQPGIPRFIDKLIDQQGGDKNDPKVRQQAAQEYMRSIGKKHTWDIQGSATLEAQTRAASTKSGKTDDSRKILTMQDQPIITKTNDPLKLGDIPFDEKGNMIVQSTTEPVAGAPIGSPFYRVNTTETAKNAQIRADKNKVKLAKYRETFPALQGKTDEETYEAYKSISEDAKSMSQLPIVDISDRAKQGLASYINSSLSNHNIYIEDGFGSTDITNANDQKDNSALKEIGWTPQTLSDELQNFAVNGKSPKIKVSGLAPGARKSGMLAIDVMDNSKANKGKWRKLYVDTNRDFAQITAPSNGVAKLIETMQSGRVLIGIDLNRNPVYAKVSPNVFKDPISGEWMYDPIIEKESSDGVTKIQRITIDDLINQEVNELSDPKYNLLNSQVDETAPTNSFQ